MNEPGFADQKNLSITACVDTACSLELIIRTDREREGVSQGNPRKLCDLMMVMICNLIEIQLRWVSHALLQKWRATNKNSYELQNIVTLFLANQQKSSIRTLGAVLNYDEPGGCWWQIHPAVCKAHKIIPETSIALI